MIRWKDCICGKCHLRLPSAAFEFLTQATANFKQGAQRHALMRYALRWLRFPVPEVGLGSIEPIPNFQSTQSPPPQPQPNISKRIRNTKKNDTRCTDFLLYFSFLYDSGIIRQAAPLSPTFSKLSMPEKCNSSNYHRR